MMEAVDGEPALPVRLPPSATVLMVAACLALSACAPPRTVSADPQPAPDFAAGPPEDQLPPGVFHRIRPGQTLFTISKSYGVSMETVISANRIQDPHRIEAGETLFIPGAQHVLDVPVTALPGTRTAGLFRPPVQAPLNSPFGKRRGRMHYGVDLGAPSGTAVRAARAGTVSYAGNGYRGYGKLVILDHSDGYQTFYAHNSRLAARKGKRVDAGDVIAYVGATGNASAPHLHFEIRKDGRPLNPARFLPL
jgi:murein DD-endopeptidase MepM/ murein hydrolase activator NlpD